MENNNISVIIIGGGAAGFFAAINCARNNPKCKVTIIEKTQKLLSKVKVSGGGRCNVTHACFDNKTLVTNYPRGNPELMGAFSRFNTEDAIKWFEEAGVELNVEEDGRMFPVSNNSETIIHCFMQQVKQYGIEIKTGCEVTAIKKQKDNFHITTSANEILFADKILIAAGGYPKSVSYEWLKQTGHTIAEPVPSLFTFNIPGSDIIKLMGVSVALAKVKIKNTNLEQSGPLLITHWGLSGPAILKLSARGARILHQMNYDFEVLINWLGDAKENIIREKLLFTQKEHAAKQLIKFSPFTIPNRLWNYFLTKASINEQMRWADVSKKTINLLLQILIADVYKVKGKTTFKEEFVTCGGIKLDEIDFKTMQSRICQGLYFAGEVLDIDGVTGGFNFQNAWTTAWIAAMDMSKL